MWTFHQATGLLAHNGESVSTGYSGFGEGRSNPALQQVPDVGPIPRGLWTIGAPECVTTVGPHGPFVLPLIPQDGTETYGRSGFLIHGDSPAHAGSASHGCIVIDRHTREAIAGSHDLVLEVVV